MKYIIINFPTLANLKRAMVFDDLFVHALMFETAKAHFSLKIEAYSAGSCELKDGLFYTFGNSETLNIGDSNGDASQILDDLFAGMVVTER
jgi:hypothetical protein